MSPGVTGSKAEIVGDFEDKDVINAINATSSVCPIVDLLLLFQVAHQYNICRDYKNFATLLNSTLVSPDHPFCVLDAYQFYI